MSLKEHYKDRYELWSGNPKGTAPDFNRCCEQVSASLRWHIPSQCSRKNGHGPDGAYCYQHNPEKVAAKRAAEEAKWNAARDLRLIEGKRLSIIEAIAKGHNDPRALATGYLRDLAAAREAVARTRGVK